MPLPGTIGQALAALAAAECRVIERALGPTRDRDRAVHRARKAIRRLRALLAVAGAGLGDALAPIDRSLQRLARSLSPLRDLHVAVTVAQKLATGDDAPAWGTAIVQLQAQRAQLWATALAADPMFARRRAGVRALAHALAALPWRRVKRGALHDALARSERRMAKAEACAREDGRTPAIHRWRRRTRRLRMQLELKLRLQGRAARDGGKSPSQLHRAIGRLKRQTDALGWRQDLQLLRRQLGRLPDPPQAGVLRQRLRREMAAARPLH